MRGHSFSAFWYQEQVTSALPWHAGLVVGGRYKLQKRLGGGAAADVWSAHDETLHATVALKLLHPGYAGSAIAKRFLREARAAAQIRSLHVVQILDHGLDDTTPFISMELLEGETLADRLDREGRLPLPSVARVMTHVARAAGKAHAAGIIHRDLKPPNVFLVRPEEGEEEIAKVFDFGIAKIEDPPAGSNTSVTKAGTLLGTPEYMSPEQATGATVDFRTDIYAMGILAFECVTGDIPFATENLAEILQFAALGELRKPSSVMRVPPAFDDWFVKATNAEPAKRFDSAKELADALRIALGVGK
jgi:serine/threonine protein kinase